MTQKEILEFNKICAKFLMTNNDFINIYYFPQFGHYKISYGEPYYEEAFRIDEMKFHSDWNWIMEVVEAIEKLDDFYVQIEENACYIYDISKFDNEQTNAFIKVDINTTSKKEAVVQAINQFLIWYNENN